MDDPARPSNMRQRSQLPPAPKRPGASSSPPDSPPAPLPDPVLPVDPAPPQFEEGGWTPTQMSSIGGKAGAFERTRIGRSTNSLGPSEGMLASGLDAQIKADDPGPIKVDEPTAPCQGCGWPLGLTAKLCTRCGYQRGLEMHATTAIGQEDAPQPLPDTRFQTWQHDPRLGRRAYLATLAIIVVGVLVTFLGHWGASGLVSANRHLGILAVGAVGALGVYLVACLFLIDYEGPTALMLLRVTSLAAGAELANALVWLALSPLFSSMPALQLAAILFGAVALFVGFFAAAIAAFDVDYTDSAFMALVWTGLRLSLTFAVLGVMRP